MYAELSMAFNWTPSQIDEITWPQYESFIQYWNDYFPPVHVMIGLFLGIKPKKKMDDSEREASMEQLLNEIGTGPVNIGKIQGMD